MTSSLFGKNEPNNQNGASIFNSIVNTFGSPQAAYNAFLNSGAQCTLPNGQRVNIQQLSDMVNGKSWQQICAEFGLNLGNFIR